MPQLFTNNPFSTLATQALSGSAQLALASGDGAKFPTPGFNDFFEVTLTQAGDVETSWEIARCTSRSGDYLDLQSVLVNTWPVGSKVELRITAGFLNGENPQSRTAPITMRETNVTSSSFGWNVTTAPHLVLTTSASLNMLQPDGVVQGTFYFMEVIYGGAHSIAWNSTYFKGVTGLALTSVAGTRDVFVFKAQTGAVLELVGFRANVGA